MNNSYSFLVNAQLFVQYDHIAFSVMLHMSYYDYLYKHSKKIHHIAASIICIITSISSIYGNFLEPAYCCIFI